MPDKLCEFTSEGIAAFSKWLRSGAPGNMPNDLLVDPVFSTPMCETELLTKERFPDRYSFGCRLVQLLSPSIATPSPISTRFGLGLRPGISISCARLMARASACSEENTFTFHRTSATITVIWCERRGTLSRNMAKQQSFC